MLLFLYKKLNNSYINNGDNMKTDKDRVETIKNESGLYNINIDCNSKEGKMLVEVVEKESSLKKYEK